jgi:hypothetical protein
MNRAGSRLWFYLNCFLLSSKSSRHCSLLVLLNWSLVELQTLACWKPRFGWWENLFWCFIRIQHPSWPSNLCPRFGKVQNMVWCPFADAVPGTLSCTATSTEFSLWDTPSVLVWMSALEDLHLKSASITLLVQIDGSDKLLDESNAWCWPSCLMMILNSQRSTLGLCSKYTEMTTKRLVHWQSIS